MLSLLFPSFVSCTVQEERVYQFPEPVIGRLYRFDGLLQPPGTGYDNGTPIASTYRLSFRTRRSRRCGFYGCCVVCDGDVSCLDRSRCFNCCLDRSRCFNCFQTVRQKKSILLTTMARFELARSKSNGLAIHRLNHSATLS